MEKRYQVFISSTFVDLKDERQATLKAILEINQMPAGMELFPATDDSAWQLICEVIDNSDYYILIVGGRYGSLDETGLGYTEKEYDYALAIKKPVIALLHENPDNLARERTETDNSAWERLKRFRAKVEKKHTCVYWRTAEDLKAKVIVGLIAAAKRHPAVGWVRADRVPSEATIGELLALRSRIAELEKEAASIRDRPPAGTEDLAQGDDRFEFRLRFFSKSSRFHEGKMHTSSMMLSWNSIFAATAPSMINEASDQDLRASFKGFLSGEARRIFQIDKAFEGQILEDFSFPNREIETCIIQLRALGLIRESEKKRSLKDSGTYWTLTPYGNSLMVQLRAVRKEPTQIQGMGGRAGAVRTESEQGNS